MDRFFSLLLIAFMISFLVAAPVGAQGTFPLEGAQENPPVTTSATGECNASLDALATEFSISCSHNAPAIAAHIHRAPRGMNGPIVFFLNSSTTFSFVVNEASIQQQVDDELISPITFSEFLDLLRAGDLYVNVHTMAVPSGEIRGQIPPPPSTIIFAQFGNGVMASRTLISDIVLLNSATTGAPVTGSVSFYNEAGEPVPVDGLFDNDSNGSAAAAISPAGHSINFELDPLGDVTLRTNGMGDLVAGSAQVESSADLGGYIRFAITGIGVAGVGESPITNGAIVPVRRSGTLSTGLAIRNAEAVPITVNLSLRENGVEVADGNVDIMIDANSRPSMFLEQYFPDADTAEFEGTVVITADGGFAAIALEFDAANGINTTLPVTPLR